MTLGMPIHSFLYFCVPNVKLQFNSSWFTIHLYPQNNYIMHVWLTNLVILCVSLFAIGRHSHTLHTIICYESGKLFLQATYQVKYVVYIRIRRSITYIYSVFNLNAPAHASRENGHGSPFQLSIVENKEAIISLGIRSDKTRPN